MTTSPFDPAEYPFEDASDPLSAWLTQEPSNPESSLHDVYDYGPETDEEGDDAADWDDESEI
jgi:hypothetical protein